MAGFQLCGNKLCPTITSNVVLPCSLLTPGTFNLWQRVHRVRRKWVVRPPTALLLLLLLVGIPSCLEIPAAQSQQQAPKLVSPEVHSDNRVTFRFYAPDAMAVLLP